MKKLILFLILLLFITGCAEIKSQVDNFKLPGLDNTKENSVLGNSGGITMDIVYPKESEKVITGIQFAPSIKINNLGSSNTDGQTCITGLDQNVFSGFDGCECLTYSFQKYDNEKFEPVVLTYGPYTLTQPENSRSDFTMTVTNKFASKSQALFKPCIRKEGNIDDCKVTTLESINGQVAISSITEVLAPSSDQNVVMALKVELTNAGTGKIINQRSMYSECADLTVDPRKEQVTVSAVIENFPFLGNVYCQAASFDKKTNKATMTCMVGEIGLFDISGGYKFGQEIQTPSKITVSYAYEERDSNKFSFGGSTL